MNRITALLVFSLFVLPCRSQTIVISQVYGGGGNAGATYKNDYIELFNPGASPVSLSGKALQYSSFSGTFWVITTLSGTINPGQYFLVKGNSGGNVGAALPAADLITSLNIGTTQGKIALTNTTLLLNGSCPTGASILDFIGYGPATNCFEGSSSAPATGLNTAIFRNNNGCMDNNQNGSDFTAASPSPRNSSSPSNICGSVILGASNLSSNIFNVTCGAGDAGSIDFNASGSFNSGNVISVQLSDQLGSFTTYTTIGSVTTTLTSGTIPFTIPQGIKPGANYLIRLQSTNPVATSSSTSAIGINSTGYPCGTSVTDYFRTRSSGQWNSATRWESSATGLNGTWVNASGTYPSAASNTVTIRSGHTVTLTSSQNVDQLVIENGGILINALPVTNTFTIVDGPGIDMDIQNGGRYIITSNESYTSFQSLDVGTTVNIAPGGSIEIGDASNPVLMTGTGYEKYATTSSTYIWNTGSIFQWGNLGTPTTDNGIYFTDVNSSVIPVWRIATSPSGIVGGSTNTNIKGVLEANANVTFTSASHQVFRNGIRGSGNVTQASSSSFKMIIDGATAELGGIGTVITNTGSYLQIGSTGTPSETEMTLSKDILGNLHIESNSHIVIEDFDLGVSGNVVIADKTAWVKTNGTGKLYISNVTTSTFFPEVFPVGVSTVNPVFIAASSAGNIYAARAVEPITPPIYNDNKAVLRTWYIAAPSGQTPKLWFGYSYPGTDTGPFYTNSGPNASIGVYIGGTWNIHQSGLTPQVYSPAPEAFRVTSTIAFNYFTAIENEVPFVVANNGAILPLDFSLVAQAKKQGSDGLISWNILDAAAFTKFELERSVDGGPYNTIATMNTTLSLDYAFTDHLLSPGVNTYRVKGIRNTGAIKYSNIVAIINGSKGLLLTSLYPNPARDRVFVNVSAAGAGKLQWEIRNMQGVLVKSWEENVMAGNSRVEVKVGGLSSGSYFISVKDEKGSGVLRFVKE